MADPIRASAAYRDPDLRDADRPRAADVFRLLWELYGEGITTVSTSSASSPFFTAIARVPANVDVTAREFFERMTTRGKYVRDARVILPRPGIAEPFALEVDVFKHGPGLFVQELPEHAPRPEVRQNVFAQRARERMVDAIGALPPTWKADQRELAELVGDVLDHADEDLPLDFKPEGRGSYALRFAGSKSFSLSFLEHLAGEHPGRIRDVRFSAPDAAARYLTVYWCRDGEERDWHKRPHPPGLPSKKRRMDAFH